MKRKVSKIGPSTLMVSLPSKWVKENHIKKSDELEVTEGKRKLIITCGKGGSEIKRISLNLESVDEFNPNFLAAPYTLGYDEVEFFFKDARSFKVIQKTLQYCIGFEIVDQREKYCLIKDVGRVSELEFDTLLRKTFLLLIEMSKDCLEALEKKEFERLEEIRFLETLNNRFTDYCRRILNKYGTEELNKTTYLFDLMTALEELADDYKRICDSFGKERKYHFNKITLNYFERVNQYIQRIYHLYYNFNIKEFENTLFEGRKLAQELYDLLRTTKKEETIIIHHLRSIMVRNYNLIITTMVIHFSELNIKKGSGSN